VPDSQVMGGESDPGYTPTLKVFLSAIGDTPSFEITDLTPFDSVYDEISVKEGAPPVLETTIESGETVKWGIVDDVNSFGREFTAGDGANGFIV
jgi:hypothetical protein